MSEALALTSDDCGCCSSSSTGGGGDTTGCCIYPLHGVGDPNTNSVVPPNRLDLIWTYRQWLDLTVGPPIQSWDWNPNLQLWQ